MFRRIGWGFCLLVGLVMGWQPGEVQAQAPARDWRVTALGERGTPSATANLYWSVDDAKPLQQRATRLNDMLPPGGLLKADRGVIVDLIAPLGVLVSKVPSRPGKVRLSGKTPGGQGIEIMEGEWELDTGKAASALDSKLSAFTVSAGSGQAVYRGTQFSVAVDEGGCDVAYRVEKGAILVSIPFTIEVDGLPGTVVGTQRQLVRAGDAELRLPMAPAGLTRRFKTLGEALAALESQVRDAAARQDVEARFDLQLALGDLLMLAGRPAEALTYYDVVLPLVVAVPDEPYWRPIVGDRLRMATQAAKSAGAKPAEDPAQDALRARIDTLRLGRPPVSTYALSKAQCWLEAGRHESTRNDRSPFVREAMAEAEKLVGALERGTAPDSSTPQIGQGGRIRADLWSRIAAVKAHPGAACAATPLACAEVGLVHAANELAQQQWRHAQPYVQRTEDLVASAEALANACPPQPAARIDAPPATPPAAPSSAPSSAPPAATGPVVIPLGPRALAKQTYAADAFFDVGQARLKSEGQLLLRDLAAKARGLDLETAVIVGHTDVLGNAAANERLSLRRAAAVRDFLVQQGLPAQRFFIEGRGGRSPAADNATAAGRAANRRVEIEVIGVQRSP